MIKILSSVEVHIDQPLKFKRKIRMKIIGQVLLIPLAPPKAKAFSTLALA